MSDINKFTTKEVLNKVLLDSSGNSVAANSHTSQEALNAVLDVSNSRLNVSLGGSNTISGDVTITGDLTVQGGGSLAFDEIIQGNLTVTNTSAGADTLLLQLRNNSSDASTSSSLRFVNSTSGASSAGGAEISAIRNANDGGSLTIKTAQDSSATLTTALTIDSSQNVGIGGSPDKKLHLIDDSRVDIKFTRTGSSDHYIRKDGHFLRFRGHDDSTILLELQNNSQNNIVAFPSGGNVGIGSDSADKELHLKGNEPTFRIEQTADANKYFDIQTGTGGGVGKLKFSSETSSNTLVIGNNARVGVNNGAPTQTLDVRGSLNSVHAIFSGQDSRGLLIETQATTNNDDTVVLNAQTSSGEIAFETNSTERMRIDAAGDLKLQERLIFSGTNNTISGPSINLHSNNYLYIAGGSSGVIIGDDSTASRMQILDNSDVQFEVASSVRFKIDTNSRISLSNNDASSGNTIFGYQAMNVAGAGASHNVAIGNEAMHDVGTSQFNVAVGSYALTKEVNGDRNVAIGYQSLYSQTNSGTETTENVGVGIFAGFTNVTGSRNTYVGANAGFGTSSGSTNNNTGIGYNALFSVSTGGSNTSLGAFSGDAITTGSSNTFIGLSAGSAVTTQSQLTAIGQEALAQSNGATASIAIGYRALYGTNAGSCADNIAIGNSAMVANITHVTRSIAIGTEALGALVGASTPSDNIAIGYRAGNSMTNCSNNIAIGGSAMGEGGGNAITGGDNIAIGTSAMNNAEGAVANNTAVGHNTLFSVTTGSNNTVIGRLAADALTTGSSNIVIGDSALGTATTATLNVAIGGDCMSLVPASVAIQDVVAIGQNAFKGASGTTDGANGTVALGRDSLKSLTTGTGNTAVGYQTLKDATGQRNSVLGYQALFSTTVAGNSVAVGRQAGYSQTDHGNNVYIGDTAGYHQTGESNIFIGKDAGLGASGADGDNNTAIGKSAGENLTSGSLNTLVGLNAGGDLTGSSNTLIGANAGHSGSNDLAGANNCVFIGRETAGSSASANNQIVIGKGATGLADNTVTLGNEFVTDVYMAQDSGATVHCAGIDFSASQSAPDAGTSTSEVLDGYEEGTWTPVLSDGTNNFTMASNQNANYTKVGRAVHFNAEFGTGSIGSASGALLLTGLPFTSASSTSEGCVNFGFIRKFNYSSNAIQLSAMVNGGATTISFFESVDDNTEVTVQCSQADFAGTGFFMRISGTYFV